MHTSHQQSRGFVALMSAIIISAVLLMVVGAGSLSSYYVRFNILDREYKRMSATLADACAGEARLKLSADAAYAGDTTVAVGTEQCYIGPVAVAGTQRSFGVRAVYRGYYTSLLVTLDTPSLAIISWKEVENF